MEGMKCKIRLSSARWGMGWGLVEPGNKAELCKLGLDLGLSLREGQTWKNLVLVALTDILSKIMLL